MPNDKGIISPGRPARRVDSAGGTGMCSILREVPVAEAPGQPTQGPIMICSEVPPRASEGRVTVGHPAGRALANRWQAWRRVTVTGEGPPCFAHRCGIAVECPSADHRSQDATRVLGKSSQCGIATASQRRARVRAIHWRYDSIMPDYGRAHVPGGHLFLHRQHLSAPNVSHRCRCAFGPAGSDRDASFDPSVCDRGLCRCLTTCMPSGHCLPEMGFLPPLAFVKRIVT